MRRFKTIKTITVACKIYFRACIKKAVESAWLADLKAFLKYLTRSHAVACSAGH
jgi:hypothetical protein